jgi:hypothetical protein
LNHYPKKYVEGEPKPNVGILKYNGNPTHCVPIFIQAHP